LQLPYEYLFHDEPPTFAVKAKKDV